MTSQSIYKFGDFTFDPSRNLLRKQNSSNGYQLAEKEAAVLSYFLARPHQVINRNELISSIWSDSYALETTINNIISTLRKELGCSAKSPKFIKTIHNKGYEFIADVSEKPTETLSIKDANISPLTLPSQKLKLIAFFSKYKRYILFIVALSAMLSYSFIYQKQTNPGNSTNTQNLAPFLLPITSEQGQEWSPNLSPDGHLLAYVHRKSSDDFWQIKIKELSTKKESQITFDLTNKFSPIWSRSGDKLFFIKTVNNACEIWFTEITMDIDNPPTSRIIDCGNKGNMSPIAIGPYDEWLYYSVLDMHQNYVIFRVNLITHHDEQMTLPTTHVGGDYSLALSPNGVHLAFLRSSNGVKTKLMVMDLSTNNLTLLTEFNHRIYSISWDKNSTALYYMNAANNLVQIDKASKKTSIASILQNKSLAPYLSNNDEQYIIDGDLYLSDIKSINITSESSQEIIEEQIIVSSSYHDESPKHNNKNNMLVFESARTGIKQIWLKENNKLKQLTHFLENKFISDKQFSPDDQTLTFLADQILYLLNLSTLEITEPQLPIKNLGTPIWSCDGKSILVSGMKNGTWNLYQYKLIDLSFEKLTSNINMIKSDCLNASLFVSVPEQGLFLYDHKEKSLAHKISDKHFDLSSDWLIKDNALYHLTDTYFTQTNLKSMKTTHLKQPNARTGSFDIVNNQMYFTKKLFINTSIKQIVNN